jgi:hypothetical protein
LSYEYYDTPPDRHYSVHPIGVPLKRTPRSRSHWSKIKSKCKRGFKKFKENCNSFVCWGLCIAIIVAILIGAGVAISHGDTASATAMFACLTLPGSFLFVRSSKSK